MSHGRSSFLFVDSPFLSNYFLPRASAGSRFSLGKLTFLLLLLTGAALAENKSAYTQFGRNIVIQANQQVGELTCFGCSVRVRGQVAGDITTFGGNVVLEDTAQVAGEVTVFGGDLRLDHGVNVAGEVTVFGGLIQRDPGSTISGDVTNMGGRGWVVPILLAPFLFIGLLVGAIIWLVQRKRAPNSPAVAA